MAKPFVFDRGWEFDAPLDELWSALSRPAEYTRWWPWLAECDVDVLREGATARCLVRPPLPYRLRFTVHLDQVVPAQRVVAVVGGDLAGPAELHLAGDGERSRARLAWELTPATPWLRALAGVARPAMVWGHDHVVASGLGQFSRRALEAPPPRRADR